VSPANIFAWEGIRGAVKLPAQIRADLERMMKNG
jgi:hypothetical protein